MISELMPLPTFRNLKRLFMSENGQPTHCVVACFTFSLVTMLALWQVVTASAPNLPTGVDAMGHLTKVEYIADAWRSAHWPSWYPHWYSGSTVMQYYPPLSYLVMALIQLVTRNTLTTFKISCFLTQFVGALGVWALCKRFINHRVGLLAGALYVLQPFLLRSLLLSGVLAQAPVFALTPWFILSSLMFLLCPGKRHWLSVCILTGCLILSHAMHAFLIAMCAGVTAVTFLVMRRTSLPTFFAWIGAGTLGAGISAFWWLPGVTSLETPGIPFLLPEACLIYTATTRWFNPTYRFEKGLYSSLSTLVISVFSTFAASTAVPGILTSLLVSTLFSVVLSFGHSVPLFGLLPFSESLVPGRILSYTAFASSVLCACVIYRLVSLARAARVRLLPALLGFLLLCAIALDVTPYALGSVVDSFKDLRRDFESIPRTDSFFENGRFMWILRVPSFVSYAPLHYYLNIADGWNIEGTPHNRTLWQHNIALHHGYDEYVVRSVFQWNVRSLFVDHSYAELIRMFKLHGFRELHSDHDKVVLFDPDAPTYFSHPLTRGLAVGLAARNFVMGFPWTALGSSPFLEDYSSDYLSRFDLLYLAEPEIRNYELFTEIVSALAEDGKLVVVEMGRTQIWPLFGVLPYWDVILPDASLVPTDGPLLEHAALPPDPSGRVPLYDELDAVWMEMHAGGIRHSVIGYKQVGTGRIYFVGLALSQLLTSERGHEIHTVLSEFLKLTGEENTLRPKPFPVLSATWEQNSFRFSYTSREDTSVWISITHSPRWTARIDGQAVPVHNLDSLILLDLPSGTHEVILKFGLTWVGKLGIALAILSACVLVLLLRNRQFLGTYKKQGAQ